MRLALGSRLGPYEVNTLIGRGGMGEVYRARDTNLGRDVALKILPDAFADDPDRLARFDREARALASLNHRSIAHIYGLEEADGVRALVMELVEGPTLADRVAQGKIPLDEALPIAKQIAEALAVSHDQGLIHRDLKPANVKVMNDGTVKLLDFGLAKALDPIASSDMANSPTVTSPAMTQRGVILGTAAYMAPEQARGRAVDRRADIWAFGCVLYEMLTATPAFKGDNVADTIAAIVRGEPDWGALPAETPAVVRRLLRGCLEKDRNERISNIAVAAFEIKAALDSEKRDWTPAAAGRPGRRLAFRHWGVALASLAAGVLLGAYWTQSRTDVSPSAPRPLVRATIDLAADAPLALGVDTPAIGYNSPVVALSPDGSSLAYVATTPAGKSLHVRSMASGELRPLAGTEGAIHPFFSPDGRWIGFLTGDRVKKVPVGGGAVISLCEARGSVLAWWTEPDVIHFTERETTILSRVSAHGGKPSMVLAASDSEVHGFSDVLPDGKAALAASLGGIHGDNRDVVLVDTATKAAKVVLRSGYGARYVSPGYLLFGRASTLMAVKFDLARREVVGEPAAIAAGAAMESLFRVVHAASSSTGLIAYVPGADLSIGKIAWVDGRGAIEYLDVPERVYGAVRLAPDGHRVAVHVGDVKDYVWIYDIARREGRRVTSSESEGTPLWSADGTRLASSTLPPSPAATTIHDVDPRGGANANVRIEGFRGYSWGSSGDVLAGARGRSGWIAVEFVKADGGAARASFGGIFPTFSPDGRWVAYQTDRAGAFEIFLRSYPAGRDLGQLSIDGGLEPSWTRAGELFYRNGHRWFSTRVSEDPEPRWDPPRARFDTEFIDTPGISYDVSPDGQRLLVVKRTHPVRQTKIEILVNWLELLPRGR